MESTRSIASLGLSVLLVAALHFAVPMSRVQGRTLGVIKTTNAPNRLADGNPPPPFPKQLLADGNPPPPFPPKPLVADGNPPPPFPPKPLLVADGNPPPPFPPKPPDQRTGIV
jgi:hypothetical protein